MPCRPEIQKTHQLRIDIMKSAIAGLINESQVANNGELTKMINTFKILETMY